MNWEQRLQNPPEKLDDKHLEMISDAASWARCACCEVNVPKSKGVWEGRPMNIEIETMGYQFYDCIEKGNWQKARHILKRIHELAKDLCETT